MSLRARGWRLGRATGAVAVALAVAFSACTSPSAPPKEGDLAPDFVLQSADGPTRKLSNYRGKVVLVNLWATWCPPCIAEMPILDRLTERYAERGLVVLGVAADDDPERVHDFLGKSPVKFQVLLDPDGVVGTQYGITGYPETFFVDRQGRVRDKIIGPLPHEGREPSAEFIARLEALLGG